MVKNINLHLYKYREIEQTSHEIKVICLKNSCERFANKSWIFAAINCRPY